MSRTTKAQLQAEVEALRHNCNLLEAKVESLEAQLRADEDRKVIGKDFDYRVAYREYMRDAKAQAVVGGRSVLIKGYAAWRAAL